MKQKMKRFMAGFLALLTVFTTLLGNGTTAFAASSSANISFWYASTRASGEVSELKAGYDHGKILYAILDGIIFQTGTVQPKICAGAHWMNCA